MKYSFFARYAVAGALFLGAASCDKDEFFGDNVDPNSPSEVPAGVVLSSLQASTAFINSNTIGRVGELFVQHMAGAEGIQTPAYDRYAIRGDFNNEWEFDVYAGALADAQNIIDTGDRSGPAFTGIAKLMKAYNFAVATDIWGDVPYSQALKGSAQLQPRFDKQEDIYKGNAQLEIQSLFDLVREGLNDLDQPPGLIVPTAANDLIYGGNIARWRKFGNTLLLKFALQISKKEPALATSVIREVLAKGPASYISDNADDFQLAFGTTVGNQNPFFSYNVTNRPGDQIASQRFIDTMNLRNDPRLPRFYSTSPANAAATTTAFGTFTGFQNGSNNAVPGIANRSRLGPYLLGNSGDAPVRMLTNFQTKFILAEAALLLGTGGDAQALFTQGIRASMTKAGVDAAAIDAYLANPANARWVTLSGSNTRRQNQIITQKWIALFGNGYEAWNDYRRTGFPRLAPVENPSSDSPTIPQRFFYTNGEISANANQVPADRPNITVPVWWASN
ncbi:SusD/RagB family nutrient-binding outer membrane lipoprotein [Hymenobacter qilianensis]|uniref:SusD/RagB family nutrient-binding outer membrane lipoprotein n=1 Tax=Hymenobacter qilianensis TaxID=1385715 RepID=A0A7H0GRF0_9BACT|nr:SusD/RagB family nutrient-binding outer membrane lipoprotein [Hymenobacter qilianensis]QNP50866.1 SusD/RagB family nutrient-binding outer membrane lipoprotein [Hymenobacter qilianensis]